MTKEPEINLATTEEVIETAKLVASWCSHDQAKFFLSFGGHLINGCDTYDDMIGQSRFIGQDIKEITRGEGSYGIDVLKAIVKELGA